MVIQFVISCLSLIKYIYPIVYCQTWCLRNKSRVHFVTALLWKDFAMRAYWNWGHTHFNICHAHVKKSSHFRTTLLKWTRRRPRRRRRGTLQSIVSGVIFLAVPSPGSLLWQLFVNFFVEHWSSGAFLELLFSRTWFKITNLRYCLNFIYSEKATKGHKRWRFRKILWPS